MRRLRALRYVLVPLASWCAAVAASPGVEGPKLVFCCSAANDLFQVSVENGFQCRRFDRPWRSPSPAWYVANYGDDNARLLMGTMAAAALTGVDRWDELMMRCLPANLRTNGRLGFRGGRIDVPALSERGWQPYFQRRIVNLSPHYEAYLWACFLRAYRETGYEPFYQRAENALRISMDQYTR